MNDLISRQDVLKALIERRNDIRALIERNKMPAEEASTYWCEIHGIYYAIDLIEAFPSAEITGTWEKHIVKHRCPRDCWYPSGFEIEGTWNEEEGSELRWDKWFCSNCGKQYDWEYNYCPNCGARMINHE